MAVPPSSGTYHVDLTLTNPDGSRTLIDGDLAVEQLDAPPTSVPPTITTPPVGTSVAPGGSATLTVVATGTPPLSYQWLKTGHAVPGATNASFSTGPLVTTSIYAVQVANAVGTATSNPVAVTVVPVTPSVGIGLEFVRTIGLPPLYMGYTYGDLTGRIVNGQVRLLFTGDWVNVGAPVYEVEVTEANVATFVKEWANPYHGKRGTWVTGTAIRETAAALDLFAHERHLPQLLIAAAWYHRLAKAVPASSWYWMDFAAAGTAALNSGHYYHPEHDLLYITYSDSYNVAGRPDWQLLALRLHDDGTTEAFGPWRVTGQDGEGTKRLGPRAAMNLRPHPTTGLMLACAGLTSGNAGCAWGTNLLGGAPWPLPSTPTGPEVPDVHNPDCYLYGYYMGPTLIDPMTGIASGPIRSTRRPLHPYVHEAFPDNNQLNFVDPAQYGGVGSWTDNDSLGGLFVLPDRTYFFGGVSGSPVQDPTSPAAAHCFYSTSYNDWRCAHGFAAVPAGITGPTSTARFPFATVYDTAALERVKRGEAIDWQQEPLAWSNLEADFGIVTAPIDSVGDAKMINGGFFDARDRLLYLMAHGADRGTVTWGLVNAAVHVFRVA